MVNKAKTYEVDQYAEKVRQALKKMEETQQPGGRKKGSKSDVIMAVKADILRLMKMEYTSEQIADALKGEDVFSILPKSITELVKGKKIATKKLVTEGVTKPITKPVTGSRTSNVTEPRNTFPIKPDKEDI
jgi:IS30 family transposase